MNLALSARNDAPRSLLVGMAVCVFCALSTTGALAQRPTKAQQLLAAGIAIKPTTPGACAVDTEHLLESTVLQLIAFSGEYRAAYPTKRLTVTGGAETCTHSPGR